MDWKYLLEDGKVAKKYMGTVLSGEKLLDGKNYRDKLHGSFPEAIGGEMEGAGLASVAMANNLYEWIIVKGICDWGYDKQSENKDKYADKQIDEKCLELWGIMFERQLGSVRESSRKLMER
ncbi:MAG: hypothetical protein NC412_08530 [Roseburia sp.]|nr:hypothetical protein [Roseburia sp.]MCM1279478.1 hypothetical protein [Robinsoniella sp.]